MEKIVDVVAIIDASASMGRFYHQTIEGITEIINKQKKYNRTRFTIATFENHSFNMLLNMCDLDEFVPDKKFIQKYYKIGGMTPLYKCSIEIMKKTQNNIKNTPLFMRPSKVACTIITDGLDNTSGKYTVNHLNQMIRKLERQNWHFAYIGMGADAQKQAHETAIQTKYDVDASEKGTKDSYNAVTDFVGIVRGK